MTFFCINILCYKNNCIFAACIKYVFEYGR